MKKQHPIELLAPAQNLVCGKSAINHGADAVYIGGPSFSARKSASNSLADIEQLVTYAHFYGAKVYAALNTLLYDNEIDSAVKLIHQYYDIGVDALIIQDMGLLECNLPPICLHASTQANNVTTEKAVFLEKVGFTQIVLARELSLDQIREIRKQTSVALEFFIHGALCVSYSGQCFISKIMAERSANRGNCAQFCRHKFTLKDSDGKIIDPGSYLLSLKDLDLSAYLESLLLAGVSSFKIEGRLKNEEYVKNITAYYRLALDQLLSVHPDYSKGSSGNCEFQFTPDPERTFHRDTTSYYIEDRRNKAVNPITPKSTGQKLGVVSKSNGNGFIIKTTQQLNNGDGLCFTDESGSLKGLRINSVNNGLIKTQDRSYPPVGTTIYRNLDTAFNKQLLNSDNCRKINVKFFLACKEETIQLQVIDQDNIEAKTEISGPFEAARNHEKTLENFHRQLSKSGDTPFKVTSVNITAQTVPFLPVSAINDLRRTCLSFLHNARLKSYSVEQHRIEHNTYPWLTDNASQYDNIINQQAEKFYRRHGVTTFETAAESRGKASDIALMKTKYCIRYQLDLCPYSKKSSTKTFKEPFFIEDNTGRYKLHFDCKECCMSITQD